MPLKNKFTFVVCLFKMYLKDLGVRQKRIMVMLEEKSRNSVRQARKCLNSR